ncbi:MAG TPA: hypothetical protein DDY49_09465 [Paenibacillaceae bacterium]|nr:hypothetical protein [Paenibacillaceae bacterium]
MMMNPFNNEKGFSLPTILILTSLIFSMILFGLYIHHKSNRVAKLDFDHLVLNYIVEGGLYQALEKIRAGNPPELEQTISVEGTPIKITLRANGEETMELFGYGEMPPNYASGIAIVVNKNTWKIVEWRDGG